MLGKLFKYDIKYIMKIMSIVLLVALSLGLVMSLFIFLISVWETFIIFTALFAIPFVIAMSAAIYSGYIITAVRMYKNLYSDEGYLTFTLPVTTRQIMWSKIFSGVIAQLIGIVSAIIMVGLPFIVLNAVALESISGEISMAFDMLLFMLRDTLMFTDWQIATWLGILGLYFVVSLFIMPIVMLFSFSVGQRASKNKVLASIGVYFAFSIVMSLVSSVFEIINMVIVAANPYVDEMVLSTYSIVQLGFQTALYIIAGSICYIIARNIMKNKLNLS